jgi:Saccharopine dehydrogenase NADP binding domain
MTTAASGRDARATPAEAGDAVVVLGGYGAVGRAVSGTLAARLPGRVIVAGRDRGRAADLAAALPGAVRARQVDVAQVDDWGRVLAGARVAVMCVERANVAVARACLARGIDYVDVSATSSVLADIARLDDLAVDRGATAVLSVGLAPGVTNLLARLCRDRLPAATAIDLTLCFGLSGDHGADSRRWVLDNLAAPSGHVARGRIRVDLPGLGRRTAHPFPFSDQTTLTEGLGIPVTTRLCFDSPVATTAVFALRAVGAYRLARRLRATGLIERAFEQVRFGHDRFVVQATATDEHGRTVTTTAQGHGECRATGIVAAHVALRLHGRATPAGVRHLDELVDPTSFLDELDGGPFTVQRR